MAWEIELNQSLLEELYVWIDSVSLSKPKTRIERDFADGTLVAEVVRNFLPDLVDIHNYTPTSSLKQKKINWAILNKKVLSRLGLEVPESIITEVCSGKPGSVELLLYNLRLKINEELDLRKKIQEHHLSSPRQSLIALIASSPKSKSSTLFSSRINIPSKSNNNLNNKWVPRMDHEELKQQCLQQQEEIEILQAKTRRLEHVIQLIDIRINELSSVVVDRRRTKHTIIVPDKQRKK